MAKIMLVEDDTNLSEIYQARLTAEGYDIVSAHDGEEALALAAKEKPDLIISDVMMPKISGFEMLDILRNTEGLKETKVIMLTALGQADDRSRAQGLGADRYLVKSQVTLEDIVKAAQELLSDDDENAATAPASAPTQDAGTAASVSAPATPNPPATPPRPTPPAPPRATTPLQPRQPTSAPMPNIPVATPPPTTQATTPSTPPITPRPVMRTTPATAAHIPQPPAAAPATPNPPATPTTAPAPTPRPTPPAPKPRQTPVATPPTSTDSNTTTNGNLVSGAVEDLEKAAPTPTPVPVGPASSATTDTAAVTPPATPAPALKTTNNDQVPIAHKKVIQPINDPTARPNLEALLEAEERKNSGSTTDSSSVTESIQPQPAVAPPAYTPHQPGHVIGPDASSSPTSNAGGDVDPNRIAL